MYYAGTPWGVEAAFAAAIRSLMVSYVRARAGLFARPERLAVIIVGLVTGLVLPALVILAVATTAAPLRPGGYPLTASSVTVISLFPIR